MANSGGGTIWIEHVEAHREHLEAAALAGDVNRYVAPRVTGIAAEPGPHGSVAIDVRDSDAKPHVFTRTEDVAESGAFHPGQIWVRRDSSNRPGDGEDVQRLVREAASAFLERLSIGVRDPAFTLRLTESAGIAVHLAEDEESVPVSPNLARLYPFTAKSLAARLGKTTNWVATAVKVLRLKESRENAFGVPSPSGRIIQWRYSEHAWRLVQDKLDADPGWNPYREF